MITLSGQSSLELFEKFVLLSRIQRWGQNKCIIKPRTSKVANWDKATKAPSNCDVQHIASIWRPLCRGDVRCALACNLNESSLQTLMFRGGPRRLTGRRLTKPNFSRKRYWVSTASGCRARASDCWYNKLTCSTAKQQHAKNDLNCAKQNPHCPSHCQGSRKID